MSLAKATLVTTGTVEDWEGPGGGCRECPVRSGRELSELASTRALRELSLSTSIASVRGRSLLDGTWKPRDRSRSISTARQPARRDH